VKRKTQTPLFGCSSFQQPLPATIISPERALMVSLAAFCCSALSCFLPFKDTGCGGCKKMGDEVKKMRTIQEMEI